MTSIRLVAGVVVLLGTPAVLTGQSYPRVGTVGPVLDGGTGGMEVDRAGNIYVADFGAVLSDPSTAGTKVFKITPDGTASVFATGFSGASGNTFDLAGNLLQSNIRGGTVSAIAPDGSTRVFATELLAAPVGIIMDRSGNAFVANCGNGSVLQIPRSGAAALYAQDSLLQCPNGIAIDDRRNVYVSNFNNGDVVRIAPNQEVSVLATVPGGNNGHLIFHEGMLYVVARGAHQLYVVTVEGEVSLLAGTGARGLDDGPALQATFSFPNDIAASPDGRTLFVNDIAATEGDHTQLRPMVVRSIVLRR